MLRPPTVPLRYLRQAHSSTNRPLLVGDHNLGTLFTETSPIRIHIGRFKPPGVVPLVRAWSPDIRACVRASDGHPDSGPLRDGDARCISTRPVKRMGRLRGRTAARVALRA